MTSPSDGQPGFYTGPGLIAVPVPRGRRRRARKIERERKASSRDPADMSSSIDSRVVENFACTGCGCVCDDLRLTISGDRIVQAERACVLAEPWLLGQSRDLPPAAEIEGQAVLPQEAMARPARLLRQARYPLIYGLSRSSTEGQSAAVALAESLG